MSRFSHVSVYLAIAAAIASLLTTSTTRAALMPLEVSGFNADLVVEATAISPFAPYADALDIFNEYAFFETGLTGSTKGIPAGGAFTADITSVPFDIADFASDNALLLTPTSTSGELTLVAPAFIDTLHVLAVSTNGGGLGAMVVFYHDGTYKLTDYGAFDWFGNFIGTSGGGNAYRPARQGLGRINLTSNGLENTGAAESNPDLYQTSIDLDLTKAVIAIGFGRGGPTNVNTATAIFGVSGDVLGFLPTPVPEPSTVALVGFAFAGLLVHRLRK
ncbi:PEP-CTERM sorting domain-containing protein [Aeoliella sp. SH292]|uniref:PEP-CTERM sorting domain-containing protein n=1 Tax=Aeoliella sp. SH292 TaxID=3454464 RepID=UPI003F9985FD